MPVSRRYTPEHDGGREGTLFGFDFAPVLAPGVGIAAAAAASDGTPTPRLEIYLNEPGNMNAAPGDFAVEPALAPLSGVIWRWLLDADGVTATWTAQPPGTPLPANALELGAAVRGRQVYAIVSGGVPGVDYLFKWIVSDTLGNQWSRAAAILSGPTS